MLPCIHPIPPPPKGEKDCLCYTAASLQGQRKERLNKQREKKRLHEDKRETYAQEKRREECFFVPVRLRGVLMHSYFFFSSSSFSDRPTFPDSLLSPH